MTCPAGSEWPGPPMASLRSVSVPPRLSHMLPAWFKNSSVHQPFFCVISGEAVMPVSCLESFKKPLGSELTHFPCIFQGRSKKKKKKRAHQCGKLIEASLLWTSVIKRPISR